VWKHCRVAIVVQQRLKCKNKVIREGTRKFGCV